MIKEKIKRAKKEIEIKLGDKIITKETAECGKNKAGKIICRHNEYENVYGIMFDSKDNHFHKLQYEEKHPGILNERKGLWLKPEDFTLIPNKNKNKRNFRDIMYSNHIEKIEAIPEVIKDKENIIKSYERGIKERIDYNKRAKEDVLKIEKDIKLLSKQKNPSFDNYDKIYEKLLKHSEINDIIMEKDYIIVKTKNLTYHHSDIKITDFDLGAYYIYIPFNLSNKIRAINYKRQLHRNNYFHPCITQSGEICMGDLVENEVYQYRKENELLFLVYLLINFLKEPNYGSPYADASEFRCAQPVTYKSKKALDYLNHSGSDYAEWNSELYKKDRIKEYEKDIKRLKVEPNYSNHIERLEKYIIDLKNN